jgi:cell filamentation protein
LKNLSPKQFAGRAAEHISELNAIHAFREGNGRMQRAFLELLAERAGHPLDLMQITPAAWEQASVEGFQRANYGPMRQVIARALLEA